MDFFVVVALLLAFVAAFAVGAFLAAKKQKRQVSAAEEGQDTAGFVLGQNYTIWTSFPVKEFSGYALKVENGWVTLQTERGSSRGEVDVQICNINARGLKA